MKNTISVFFLSAFVVIVFSFSGCKKDNTAPTASFTINPAIGNLSIIFSFDASACTDEQDDASKLEVRWDWNGDGAWDTEYSTEKTLTHQYSELENYSIVLEVKDTEGLTATSSKDVVVSNSDLLFSTGAVHDIEITSAKILGEIISAGADGITQHGHCWSYFPVPSTNNNKTEFGSTNTPTEFDSELSGLIEGITYYARAYVESNKTAVYGDEISFTTDVSSSVNPCQGAETVTDSEGNVYNTVQIDNKCWMKENLKIGTMINSSLNQSDNTEIEKYCYNDDERYCNVFGGFYQWDEMMNYVSGEDNQGICPDGWHIPTFEELESLNNLATSGNDLIAIGASGSSNNSTGFSALMSGYLKYVPKSFIEFETASHFWSTKQHIVQTASMNFFISNDGETGFLSPDKHTGISLRCVKDD